MPGGLFEWNTCVTRKQPLAIIYLKFIENPASVKEKDGCKKIHRIIPSTNFIIKSHFQALFFFVIFPTFSHRCEEIVKRISP
jgi:hypothetical protein